MSEPTCRRVRIWVRESTRHKYAYNSPGWTGVIQSLRHGGLQEIVWSVKPDVIVETGMRHGGSLVYSASLLALLGGDRFVVGVDVDIRATTAARSKRSDGRTHPL